MPPNYSKNDFESVKSELVWKLENWNGGRLDRLQVGMMMMVVMMVMTMMMVMVMTIMTKLHRRPQVGSWVCEFAASRGTARPTVHFKRSQQLTHNHQDQDHLR